MKQGITSNKDFGIFTIIIGLIIILIDFWYDFPLILKGVTIWFYLGPLIALGLGIWLILRGVRRLKK